MNDNQKKSLTIVRTLASLGVQNFFISPGYRNAPLIWAIQQTKEARPHSFFDERGAGFAALGFGKATGQPAILCCTSGTAGGHYLPAIMEARKSQIPLLVLTSDRPFELIHTQANQTVEQQDLYGGYVKKSISLPIDVTATTSNVLKNHCTWLTEICLTSPKGPVHINCPFREPLEPTEDHGTFSIEPPYWSPVFSNQIPSINPRSLGYLKDQLMSWQRPLILVGSLSTESCRRASQKIIKDLDAPYYCDILSGLRGEDTKTDPRSILDGGIKACAEWIEGYRPDGILHLGGRLVSKWFDQLITKLRPDHYIVIHDAEGIPDPTGRMTGTIRALPGALEPHSFKISSQASSTVDQIALKKGFQNLMEKAPLSAPVMAAQVWHALPDHHGLFLGNSSIVRAFDRYAREEKGFTPKVFGSRGVSGIDGQLATAIGVSIGLQRPMTCVLGDITALHDLNTCLLLKDQPHPVVLIILNNSGGKIFNLLPINKHPEIMDPLMTTPHNHQFAGIASMAHLSYDIVDSIQGFHEAYHKALMGESSAMIEVSLSDSSEDYWLTNIPKLGHRDSQT